MLERHIAQGTRPSSGLRNGQLQTWGTGTTVAVVVDGDTITYGDARLIERDIEIGRWVIHVIDAVVLPPHVESPLS